MDQGMSSKKVYRVTTAGLDLRDVRLIEIVFKHSQYNKYEFALVGADQAREIDLLIANTAEAAGLDAIANLRAARHEVPVIAALPRGAVSSTRHAISIDRLTLQLLPILNRVIDIEFNPQAASQASAPTSSAAAELPKPVSATPINASQVSPNTNQFSAPNPNSAASASTPTPTPTSTPTSLSPLNAASTAPASAPAQYVSPVQAQKSNLVALPSALGSDGSLIERLRVLIVDDSPTVRQQLAQAFNRMGVISEVAASAAEALSRLSETSFHLALVDVVMPEMDGYKLTKEIKRNKAHKQMPVIILTSKSSPFDLARGALAGCDTYLTKPVPLKDLEAAVVKQLRKALAIDDISGLIRLTTAPGVKPGSAPTAQAHPLRSGASTEARSLNAH